MKRTCREAHIEVMLNNDRAMLRHFGIKAKCSVADKAELAAKMEARFKEWTGKSLVNFLRK